MECGKRDEMRDYAWKYFSMHADQRLKTFNFYLVLVTVIIGGMLAYIKDAKHPSYCFPVGLLLLALSFVFWKLDIRTRELIRHAEDALKLIEQDSKNDGLPEEMSLFCQEDSKTAAIRQIRKLSWSPISWWRAHYSYSDCFQIVFGIFGLVGLTMAIVVFSLPKAEAPLLMPQQQFNIGIQPVAPQSPR